jgi:hypothetical protein
LFQLQEVGIHVGLVYKNDHDFDIPVGVKSGGITVGIHQAWPILCGNLEVNQRAIKPNDLEIIRS